jgi:hypothetical protein
LVLRTAHRDREHRADVRVARLRASIANTAPRKGHRVFTEADYLPPPPPPSQDELARKLDDWAQSHNAALGVTLIKRR